MAKSFKVVTDLVRFSYVNLFTPLPQGDGKPPKYSVALIIPKEDTKTIEEIEQAISDCKKENMYVWGGLIPHGLRGGLRDGDLEKNDVAYANSMFINCSASQKPGIVYEDLRDITDPSEFYSGCYGKASVTFYAYNNSPTQQGVGCTINNVMKIKDGERLGMSSLPIDDFKKKSF